MKLQNNISQYIEASKQSTHNISTSEGGGWGWVHGMAEGNQAR